jgi:hypothetical protein
MSKSMTARTLLLLPVLLLATPAAAQPAPTGAAAPAVAKAPPPAFQAGMPVFDGTGMQVGKVASLADSPRGPMVVVEIDGKMVSLPQSTLTLARGTARSTQSKAEMLAAAGAPG